jgi:hypothetical protein
MGHKTIAMAARYAHLAPTYKVEELGTLVRAESVPVPSGPKLATDAENARKAAKPNASQVARNRQFK